MTLPPDWDFTVRGLIAIVPEGKDFVYAQLKHLEALGYVQKKTLRDHKGHYAGTTYRFLEKPHPGLPDTVNPPQSIYSTNKKKSNSLTGVRTREDHLRVLNAMFDEAVEEEQNGPKVIEPKDGPEGQLSFLDGKLRDASKKEKLGSGVIPEVAHRIMYRICYNIKDRKQEATLSSTQRGRVASVLGKLQDAGADFGDLNRFERWWPTFWKSKGPGGNSQPPNPHDVLELWWFAMEQTQPKEESKGPEKPHEEVTFESLNQTMMNFAQGRKK